MSPAKRIAYCTTREAAQMLGVSLRTVQLWSENGLLEAWKTEGGHRRINRASVESLLHDEQAPRRTKPPEVMPDLQRIKVLVVEDDNILLKLYRTVMASWNLPADVITTDNGIEGLIRVGRDSPDLLITDLGMPGMDGFSLIRNLAASSFREGMEIIVVTGLNADEMGAHGGLPPDIRILPKPVPFNELRTILSGIVERRAAYL